MSDVVISIQAEALYRRADDVYPGFVDQSTREKILEVRRADPLHVKTPFPERLDEALGPMNSGIAQDIADYYGVVPDFGSVPGEVIGVAMADKIPLAITSAHLPDRFVRLIAIGLQQYLEVSAKGFGYVTQRQLRGTEGLEAGFRASRIREFVGSVGATRLVSINSVSELTDLSSVAYDADHRIVEGITPTLLPDVSHCFYRLPGLWVRATQQTDTIYPRSGRYQPPQAMILDALSEPRTRNQ